MELDITIVSNNFHWDNKTAFILMYFFIFFHYRWFTVFCQFLLYSMVTQLHIYVYILFSHIIRPHHK